MNEEKLVLMRKRRINRLVELAVKVDFSLVDNGFSDFYLLINCRGKFVEKNVLVARGCYSHKLSYDEKVYRACTKAKIK